MFEARCNKTLSTSGSTLGVLAVYGTIGPSEAL
jgi:hypothetical protein